MAMAMVVVRLDVARPNLSFIEKTKSVDWIGGILFIGSTCSLLIGLTWAGSEHPWSSTQTLVTIIIGVLSFAATIAWEIMSAAQPFLRLKLFKSRAANAAFFCAFLQGLIMFIFLYYLPFYFETCKDQTPVSAAIELIPITSALLPTSIIISILLTRLGRYRWAIWFGNSLATLASGLLILLDEEIPTSHWIPIFVCVGVGHGAILMSLTICVQATANTEDVAYAAATYTFLRSLGLCIGVAIGGTVFQNTMTRHLSDLGLPVEVASNAEAFVKILKAMQMGSVPRMMYVSAYAQSFRNVFETSTAISAVGLLSSLLIKGHTMDKKLDSEHVIRKRDKAAA